MISLVLTCVHQARTLADNNPQLDQWKLKVASLPPFPVREPHPQTLHNFTGLCNLAQEMVQSAEFYHHTLSLLLGLTSDG